MILNRSIHIGEQAKRRVSACVKNFYMQRWGYCTRITTGELIYSMKNFPIKLERVQSITLSCSYSVTVLQKVRAEATGHIGMALFFNKVGNSSINHTWAVDTRHSSTKSSKFMGGGRIFFFEFRKTVKYPPGECCKE